MILFRKVKKLYYTIDEAKEAAMDAVDEGQDIAGITYDKVGKHYTLRTVPSGGFNWFNKNPFKDSWVIY